jgi:hypothetical protein
MREGLAMDNIRLRHNAAVRASKALLKMACGLLLEWEKRDFYDECFQILQEELERYDVEVQEQKSPPKPSQN